MLIKLLFRNFSSKNLVYLGLGSNLGNKYKNLNTTLNLLRDFCEIDKTSQIYQSPCINEDGNIVENENTFLNAVVKVYTQLEPNELLTRCKNIEKLLGRKPKTKNYQEREIDIDILTYNNDVINSESLTIPHKELLNRLFVLKPLLDIDSDMTLIDRYTGKEIVVKNIVNNISHLFKAEANSDKVCYLGKTLCLNIGDEERLFNLSERPLLMGVINCTPDSFSVKMDKNYDEIMTMLRNNKQFIDIIDISGESTRPNAKEVDQNIELDRVAPLIQRIRNDKELQHIPISIDTRKAYVAFECIQLGANIINDVSGGRFDPNILKVAARYDVPYICMHSRGTPETMEEDDNLIYDDLITTVFKELHSTISKIKEEGVPDWNIIIDPGIGFAKTVEHNFQILRNLKEFKNIFPNILLLGASKKRFIKKEIGDETIFGDAAITAHAVANGVNIIRVHDIKEMSDVIKISKNL